MSGDIDPDVRAAVIDHVLRELYPDRQEGEVIDTAPTDDGLLVGVKAEPSGYLSTAKYALVTVVDGQVVGAEPCSGRDLRREFKKQDEE